MKTTKPKCRNNNCLRYGFFENGICEKCTKLMNNPKPVKRKPIKKVSNKFAILQNQYKSIRNQYLKENSICVVTGKKATEIHHMKGRLGNLLIDTRYFLSVSREAHIKIELNPIWAKENGYSLNRN